MTSLIIATGEAYKRVYSVFADKIDVDNQQILNIEHANNRGLEMVKYIQNEPFQDWGLIIY